jgi:hypothetical protein
MQEELVRMVAQKTGLPEDKARMAAETVIGFLKERLPEPIASQLDSVARSGASAGGGLGDMAKGFGDKLGV